MSPQCNAQIVKRLLGRPQFSQRGNWWSLGKITSLRYNVATKTATKNPIKSQRTGTLTKKPRILRLQGQHQ